MDISLITFEGRCNYGSLRKIPYIRLRETLTSPTIVNRGFVRNE
jgi:hypothetical protein